MLAFLDGAFLAQAAAAAPAAQDAGNALAKYGPFAITLAVLIVPWFLGAWLAKMLRLPDFGKRIGLVLFALIFGLTINFLKWPPRYGVDLSGGVNLIYEVDDSQRTAEQGPIPMDQLLAAITKRVNPGGLKEVVVRPYGDRQVEIIIPMVEEEEVQRIEEHISQTGSLEFRILASREDDASLVADGLATEGIYVRLGDEIVARWVQLDDSPGNQAMDLADRPEFAVREGMRGGKPIKEILVRMNDGQDVSGQFLSRASVGIDDKTGNPAVDFQFNHEGAERFGRLTADNLPDPARNRASHLAVILDGRVFTAPTINSVITDRGQITSPAYTDRERDKVQRLVDVLNAGSLPTALKKEPVSRRVTGPLLGQDSIEKGKLSILVSTGAVLVFMLVYYRAAGLIACGALIMNVILTVALMMLFNAAFTLPGLAGLVLTVGMAVDANVLIYERMREELSRGATLRMAIRNGFDRAWSAIFDSNVTTLISAVILFFIGTDQVKGFATTLFIGVAMSMFTAIYCARVAFDVAERKRWMTTLHMTQLIGETHFDFVKWMRPAMVASAILIVAGLATVFTRGKNLLDIDFTGGVSVEAVFEQPIAEGETPVREKVSNIPETVRTEVRDLLLAQQGPALKAEIRKELSDGQEPTEASVDAELNRRLDEMTTLPGVAVSSVTIAGEPANKRFLIDTSNPSIEAVELILTRLFVNEKLARNTVEIGEVAMIDAPLPATTTTSSPAAETASETPSPPVAPPTTPTSSDAPTGSCGVVYQDAPAESGGSTPPSEATEAPSATEPPAAQEPATPTETPAPTEVPTATETPAAAETPTPAPPVTPPTAAPATPPVNESPAAIIDETAPSAASKFVGGTRGALKFSQKMSESNLRKRVQAALDSTGQASTPFDVTNPGLEAGDTQPVQEWTVRLALPVDQARVVLDRLRDQLEGEPFFPSSSSIGGQVAANTQWSAIYALIASLVAIAVYLWVRFQRMVYGVAAVIALIHDVLVSLVALSASYYLAPYLGFLGVEQFKINLPIIAAFLTIIGFSINDTIVIFDRMREVRGKSPKLTAEMINLSLNQTLSRTILTSLTVFITVIIMYVMGGQGIHGFAFAMLVGVISGTYSTVFIAAPLVLWLGAPADVQTVSERRQAVAAGSGR